MSAETCFSKRHIRGSLPIGMSAETPGGYATAIPAFRFSDLPTADTETRLRVAHADESGSTPKAGAMTGENAPPLDGFALPERYHCGDWCERDCHVCGVDAILHPQVPSNIELGAE